MGDEDRYGDAARQRQREVNQLARRLRRRPRSTARYQDGCAVAALAAGAALAAMVATTRGWM